MNPFIQSPHATKPHFVVIESPYAPQSKDPAEAAVELARNISYARAMMRECIKSGQVPFASHLLYTQDGILDDTNPHERKNGIEAGFSIAEALFFDSTLNDGRFTWLFCVDRGVSKGMQLACEENSKRQVQIPAVNYDTGTDFWRRWNDSLWTLREGKLVLKGSEHGDFLETVW